MEQKFQTFSVEYTQRSGNKFADALATLGSQMPFKGKGTLIRVIKQEHFIIRILKKMFPEEPGQKDWRYEIKGKIEKWGHEGSIKELKDYTLIEGKLYRRLLGGILSKCINDKEGKLRLEELHGQICGIAEKISLYRRMQRMGYYWSNMSKEVATVQDECQRCWLSVDKEESYAMFVIEDRRTPFMEYLAQGILPTDRTLAY